MAIDWFSVDSGDHHLAYSSLLSLAVFPLKNQFKTIKSYHEKHGRTVCLVLPFKL